MGAAHTPISMYHRPTMDEFLVELADLARRPRVRAEVGGKAGYLARLWAAGLPVPGAVVITAQVAELDERERAEVLAGLPDRLRAAGVRAPFAVRSSALAEDDVSAAAPGVFASLLHVDPDQLSAAVTRVWASAQTELAREYARLRGLIGSVRRGAVAVIIQQQVPAVPAEQSAAGVLYTRLPGQPDSASMRLQVSFSGDRSPGAIAERSSLIIERQAGEREAGERQASAPVSDSAPPLPAELLARLGQLAQAAERAIDAPGGADVEWVRDGDLLWLVQARPIVHPATSPQPTFPPALLAFSRVQPELRWRWDVAHNPEPLSAAQAGLVERMDAAGVAPYRMRVVGGYLYAASEDRSSESTDSDRADSHLDAVGLREQVTQELIPALEAALAPVANARPDTDIELTVALAAYERFYQLYASRLAPLLRRATGALPGFLREYVGADAERMAGRLAVLAEPAGVAAELARAAHGTIPLSTLLERIGAMAPAWDVACPTFAETPGLLRAAVARMAESLTPDRAHRTLTIDDFLAETEGRLPAEHAPVLARHIALARTARELSETDDYLFARAQAAVRHALLTQARRWHLRPVDDIFALPLDSVLGACEHDHPPDLARVQRLARANGTARERQRAWRPPLSFAGGVADEAAPAGNERDSFTGHGLGPRVRGRAVRVDRLDELAGQMTGQIADDMADGAIFVTATVTPAMAVWMRGARALVAEHGGLLDHGAAMARELGIPCVVGCAGAWSDIHTGDELWVDGDAGLVVRLAGGGAL